MECSTKPIFQQISERCRTIPNIDDNLFSFARRALSIPFGPNISNRPFFILASSPLSRIRFDRTEPVPTCWPSWEPTCITAKQWAFETVGGRWNCIFILHSNVIYWRRSTQFSFVRALEPWFIVESRLCIQQNHTNTKKHWNCNVSSKYRNRYTTIIFVLIVIFFQYH